MNMLTTLLLADAVEKGGPGSGPHPAAWRAGDAARQASQQTRTIEDHKNAADLHAKAASAFRTAAADHPKGSGVARLANANAKFHDKYAAFHTSASQGKAVPMAAAGFVA
jgi:hypothetical protein